MFRQITAALVAVSCAAGTCGAAGLRLPARWSTGTGTFLETAPTVADLRGDGACDVLTAAREEMIAIGHDGAIRWRFRTRARYMTYPAVLALPGRPARIYAADNGGQMTCLDANGSVVWQKDLAKGAAWAPTALCDPEHDGRWAAIQTDTSGAVWAFEAETGAVRWKASVAGMPVGPAVGDVDGDGRDEIAVATSDGRLALFDARGRRRWERVFGGPSRSYANAWETCAPVMFRASGGRGRIAIASPEGAVTCYDAAGRVLWKRAGRGVIASTISVGDIDADGKADIFAASELGMIYRYDEDGRRLWTIEAQGTSNAAGALIDIDGDGRIEYVRCSQHGRMLILDRDGRVVLRRTYPCLNHMTPGFGRVIAGSRSLQMVVSDEQTVHCLDTPAPADLAAGLRPWDGYRGGPRKTGAWFGLRPRIRAAASGPAARATAPAPTVPGASMSAALPGALASGEPARFNVAAPPGTPLPLAATARCTRPDGTLCMATTPVVGTRGRLDLTVDVTAPGAYRFEWDLEDANGRPLASGRSTQRLIPLAGDRRAVAIAVSALGRAIAAASALPLTAAALRGEMAALERDALALRGAASGDAARRALTELARRARRDRRLAAAAAGAAAMGRGTSLVAFEGATWESRDVDGDLPERIAIPLRVTRRVVPGEHDPVSLRLLNIADRALVVRTVVEPGSGGPAARLMRSAAAPTKFGGLAWDPLPRLDDSATITIPPLETREVWLDAAFEGTAPGEHTVRVRFQALNGAGVLEGGSAGRDEPAPETTAELRYRVLPLVIAKPGVFRLCCWASVGPAEAADLLEHGNNVFTMGSGEPVLDAAGRIAGFDYRALDAKLALLQGRDTVALLQGTGPARAPHGSPEYLADLRLWLADLKAHMAAQGFDTAHFALYPFDEPGGNGTAAVDGLAAFGGAVKSIDPSIRIYVDGGGELPQFQKFGPFIDIWCPAIQMLPDDTPEMRLIRGTGKELWSYDCGYSFTHAMRAARKDTNNIAEFRTAALVAMRYGASGIGFWCYNLGANQWMRSDDDYPLVYPGTAGPVASRRWEAVREGIEDYRILVALREAAARSGSPALRDRVRRLIEVDLPGLLDRSRAEVRLGLGRAAYEASLSQTQLDEFRAQMLDCAERVKE